MEVVETQSSGTENGEVQKFLLERFCKIIQKFLNFQEET